MLCQTCSAWWRGSPMPTVFPCSSKATCPAMYSVSPQRIACEYGSGGGAMPAGSRYVRSTVLLSLDGIEGELERVRTAEGRRAALDRAGQAQRRRLCERPSCHLHAARHAARPDAGGDGDRGHADEVEGRSRANERLDHGLGRAVELVLELVDALGGGRDGRREQRVEPVL